MGALPDRAAALARDAADPLAAAREQFVIADDALIYMDGNSLGRLPRATVPHLHHVVEEAWGAQLIRGWGTGWYEAPQRIGDRLGTLLGAAAGQVLMCDSTSVNLFKVLLAALALRPGRHTIVSDVLNFPSDLYLAQGCAALLGGQHRLRLVPSHDTLTVGADDIAAALDDDTAVVMLTHVAFKSGAIHDMAAITAAAHAVGALVIWDLSHSAGVLPLALDACNVDFAVGCSYKYLNGGPGAPGYLYVNAAWHEQAVSPIWGWFGQHQPFGFALDYTPAAGIARFLAGTPPILALAAIEPAVEQLAGIGIAAIRAKSMALTGFMIELFDALLAPVGYTLGSPRDVAQLGGHVSVRHPAGYQINQALIERLAVIPDFREPDNIRLGMSPLTTRFVDVWETADRLRRAVVDGHYQAFAAQRRAVT